MGMKGFVEGGVASIVAGCSTHPLDLIKVRMQLQGESLSPAISALRPAVALQGGAGVGALPHPQHHHPSLPPPPRRPGPISVGVQIFRTEGTAALFSGVSATVLRQTLYSTTRMGLYDILKKKWSTSGDGGSLPLHRKVSAGLIAGGIGAVVGNPADVAMVRMQADGRLPLAERRNYKSVLDAIGRMARQEGVASLWRGSSLTVNRAMIVTASQLATYDQAKEAILRRRGTGADGLGTHVVASFAAGLVAAAASNPVDVVKTRVMNMKVEKGSAPPYAGALDCAVKTVRAEGPTHGALQGLRAHRLPSGPLHRRPLRHARAGAQAPQGLLKSQRERSRATRAIKEEEERSIFAIILRLKVLCNDKLISEKMFYIYYK